MSRYPDNMRGPSKETLDMHCSNEECEACWEAEVTIDLGSMEFDNSDDENCPQCGAEGYYD